MLPPRQIGNFSLQISTFHNHPPPTKPQFRHPAPTSPPPRLYIPQQNSSSTPPRTTCSLQNTRLTTVQTLFRSFLRPLPLRPIRKAPPEKPENSSRKSPKSAANLSFPQSNSPSTRPCTIFSLQNTRLNAVQTLFCLFLANFSSVSSGKHRPNFPLHPAPHNLSPCKKAAQTRPCNANLSGRGRKLPKRGM